ncbi:N-6 DNA methylase [Serratia fonticola]|uniref:site-specific DNA-methyltransferase (adenine-specific) n=1 Tax=Serratia fonticola TaxID=47917 RepID=A0AAW3WWE5_SERFO|nr:N-6 DNA methylase [Serratia fonticola]MBC3214747.1 SAM-dependent DNA methyltransferase [Serratia fonticola]NYA15860.1 SAM-dependent DNA methyltransferase [Serratia fonticola]NYA35668.1 SAM-dependent DNA methyltransferase [Serratia fonticola]
MSQLNFAAFFDQAKESSNDRTSPDVSPVAVRSETHRMMSFDVARKQFISIFAHTARHLRRWDVFSDFITLAASEMDLARVRTAENIERSRKILTRYEKSDIDNLHRLFQLMVCALESKFHDFLGSIFMELELGSGDMGQYFTPYSVQSLMARMLIPGIKETIDREGFATISDPACGSAGMIVAYAECLLEADINPSAHLFASCIDIDPIAADMAFIQLSLLGIAAEVVTGNTLTMQLSRVRYTPVYYLNGFEEKLNAQLRIKAMLNFMRGTQKAA